MQNKKDLEKHFMTINAIEKKDVKELNMPVAIAVQEAEDLHVWCQPDKDALVAAGLDWALAESIPSRAGACRQAQSEWMKEVKITDDAEKTWKHKSPQAYGLRDELLHEFSHGFRSRPDLNTRVRAIREGGGNADMLQDLNDLAVLGKENIDLLSTTEVSEAQLDEAAALSDELGSVLAIVNGERQESSEAKDLRDKAFTFLKQAVDEVRYHGQYKFWRTPERKKGYVSKYHKN